jgi:type IV pilus assembly protein PilN
MRITLNLASKPFIELRPLYAQLRWWMAILLIAAAALWMLNKTESRKAALVNAKMASVQANIQRLQNQQRSYEAMMRQPPNAAVLTQSVFLNQLFARKAFSWTAIMMDLENVQPGGVQVMNIDPATDKTGKVTIRLRVNGQRDRAVELVRNLEHSTRFLEPRLASESAETSTVNGNQNGFQPASGPTNVNFDVLADYNPLPSREAAKDTKPETEAAPTTGDAKTPPPTAARHKHAPPLAQPAPGRPHPAAKGAQ